MRLHWFEVTGFEVIIYIIWYLGLRVGSHRKISKTKPKRSHQHRPCDVGGKIIIYYCIWLEKLVIDDEWTRYTLKHGIVFDCCFFWTVITLWDLIDADVGSSVWAKKRRVRAEMVNRGRFHARKLTPSLITYYTIFLFAFSIFVFFFYVRNVSVDQDPRPTLLSRRSKSRQVLYSLPRFSIQFNLI